MSKNTPNQLVSMETAIKQHLTQTVSASDSKLYGAIIKRLAFEQELKALKPQAWTAGLLFLGSLALLIIASVVSWKAFGQTQTAKYLSLVFTDFSTVAINWQDFSYSILENLPFGAISFFLISVTAGVVILDFSSRQFKNFKKVFFHQTSHSNLVNI